MNNLKRLKNVVALLIIAMYFYSCILIAGSYPYAEEYYFEMSSWEELVDKIIETKQKYKNMNIYSNDQYGNVKNMDCMTLNFYMTFFLVDSIGYLCAINTNQENMQQVCLLLVSVADSAGIERGKWKRINTNALTNEENEKYKYLFKTHILNKLKSE